MFESNVGFVQRLTERLFERRHRPILNRDRNDGEEGAVNVPPDSQVQVPGELLVRRNVDATVDAVTGIDRYRDRAGDGVPLRLATWDRDGIRLARRRSQIRLIKIQRKMQ